MAAGTERRGGHTPTRTGMAVLASVTMVAALVATLPGAATASEVPLPNVVSDDPVDWTPDVEDGKVRQTATVGSTTVAVGAFTRVTERGTGRTFARQNIVAFDDAGRVSMTFVPDVRGIEIYDVISAGDGHSVYIAGAFSSVNGKRKTDQVARLDVVTGALDPVFRSPGFDNRATELALKGGRLYVGGAFTKVGGRSRTVLVALNPRTGDDTGQVDLAFSGTQNGGVTTISKMSVSPDGSRLIAVGNFASVNGRSRPQIAMVDLRSAPARLHSWATQRYGGQCSSRFRTYVNDVDIAPNGEYFVVVTTGAYSGGPSSRTLCDTAARWELGRRGPKQQPSWVDYSGGDTLTAVAVSGGVVYVGGHFRWMNNPFANDEVGPGGVHRRALAALDARNGLPLTWDPERDRGWGVWGFRVSPRGLWLGHDTDEVGFEQRKRIALMPVAGGRTLPDERTGSLPGPVHLLGRAPKRYTGGRVLYRVNAGGPRVLSVDGGPDWAADTSSAPSPRHTWGSVSAQWNQVFGRAPAVPASTPQAIFSIERADPASAPEMDWNFPVKAGTSVQVRLYFASGCRCTTNPGDRSFDVEIDGATRLNDYDIVADVGHSVGTMKSFTVVSDGNVDIDFRHVVENPLVNGIEIIRPAAAADPAPVSTAVRTYRFTGNTVTRTSQGAITTTPVNWARSRGAFMVDDRLYTGWADGQLYRSTFDGTTFKPLRPVNLYGLAGFSNDIQSSHAMFYDRSSARVYFNQAGESGLYYRYFAPESGVVGAIRYRASAGTSAVNWASVRGTFLVGRTLYLTTARGRLQEVRWRRGELRGSVRTVSGPARDGHDWRARALFLEVR